MRRLWAFVILSALPLGAQFKPSKVCKFLTPEEAAAVIGAGAVLKSAIENGGCIYRRGPLSLTVAQPAQVNDRRALDIGSDSMSKGGKPVDGVADRAHLKKENSGYQLVFRKRDTLMSVQVDGDGSDGPAVAGKLIEAAKKVSGRL